MANIDNAKFNELLKQGKIEEAKQLLKDFINSEWTKEDEGEYYVNLISEYIQMSNTINKAYLTEVKHLTEALDKLDDIENESEKNAELGKIRDQINSL